MARIKRFYSIYDFPDYREFSKVYNEEWPEWYLNSLLSVDNKRLCRYCGKQLPATRKHLCSEMCEMYYRWAILDSKINSLRRAMHRYYKFECCSCPSHLSYFTPSGIELPVHIGEIDHVVPLKDGGDDTISNIQLLCDKCHNEKTEEQR